MRRAVANAVAAATILALLSGCAGRSGDGATPSAGSATPSVSASDGPSGAGPPDATPFDVTLYLTPQHGLSPNKPATAARVAETASFFDPQTQASNGIPVPPWPLENALPIGWRVTALKADVWISTDGPQASPLAAASADPFILWIGEDHVTGPTQSVPGPNALTPGQVVHFEKALELPPAGLVYLPHGLPALRIGYFYSPNAANPLFVLVGAEQASSLTLKVTPYMPPTNTGSKRDTFTGSFAGAGGGGAGDPSQSAQDVPFAVDTTDEWVFAELTATSAAGRIDLDLTFLDPGGKRVWASTGPDAHEIIRIYEVNLQEAGTGTYSFRVGNFQSVQASFTLAVTTTGVAPVP